MKNSCSIETYKDKIENNLLNVEIVHLNKYSILIVLRDSFDFDEVLNMWKFNQYYLVIPSFLNITKEDIVNNFFDWISSAKDNESLNNRKFV